MLSVVLIAICYPLKVGAIAQLGERLHGMQEVVGSNPIGSIFEFSAISRQTTLQNVYCRRADVIGSLKRFI